MSCFQKLLVEFLSVSKIPVVAPNGLVVAESILILDLWYAYMETIQGIGKIQKGAKVIQIYVVPCLMNAQV